jgi:outer membrane receptor protein involved in Fe transport
MSYRAYRLQLITDKKLFTEAILHFVTVYRSLIRNESYFHSSALAGFIFIAGTACLTLVPGSAAAQRGDEKRLYESIEEIVVTAQRREEKLSNVPISVAAFSPDRMDAQGIRSIDDIARLTPGINFTRADGRNSMASNISIRGISSTVAASTTGIYIDDTPLQVRIIGAGAAGFNTYPAIFDLERVEVLRGPQGTLFGSGSEGGTLRFITPKPSLDTYSVYARGELATIDGGGENYEGGIAVGGPISEGKLGFRLSAWQRRQGGFIDRVNTDPQPGDAPLAVLDLDPSTPPTVIPARRTANRVMEENTNSLDSTVIKGTLMYAPNDKVEITASLYYQDQDSNDAGVYWEHLSDPDNGRYAHSYTIPQPSSDEFWLPSLTISWDFGPVRLFSSTSYYDRSQDALNDYTVFESSIWARYWEYPVGMFAPTTQINTHESWTQEVRLESTDTASRLRWVAGLFYQVSDQVSIQRVQNTFLPDLFFDSIGVPFAVVFGQGLEGGRYTFNQDPVISTDEQLAGFFQVDYDLTENITLSAGVRVADTSFDSSAIYNGPVVGGAGVNDAGAQEETPVTPRFGVSYRSTPDNMFYATAAKGYRVGGYNPQIGLPCIPQLATLGYFPSAGNPTGRPTTFDSDTLWSYELGTKNTFFDGRGRLNASGYYIDWDNIQQGVGIGSCGFAFTINAGSAVSAGFDLEASYALTDQLTVGTALGYTDAEFKETVLGGPAAVVTIITDGDSLPGAPWTVTLNGQYDFTVFDADAFVRFDYEFRSEGPDDTPGLNPANRSPVQPPLDPLVARPAPETHTLSMRAGVLLDRFNISVFVQNLLNENPNLGRGDLALSPAPFGVDTHNYTGRTLTPRTVGATITYRY